MSVVFRAPSMQKAVPAPDAFYRALHRIADEAEPNLRRALLRAFRRLQAGLGLPRLEDLFQYGDAQALERVGFWRAVEDELGAAVTPTLRTTVLAGGLATTRRLPELGVQFDLTNPRALRAVEQQGAQLVHAITEESRQAIQRLIEEAVQGQFDVRQLARQIRSSIGLTSPYAVAVERYRAGLVDQGIAEGKALDRAQAYADRLLRARAETIARTEVMTAVNAGQQAVWDEATQQGTLAPGTKRVWIVTPDDRLCPYCAPLDGQEVGLQEAFDSELGPVDYPPLHQNCRCAIGLAILEES